MYRVTATLVVEDGSLVDDVSTTDSLTGLQRVFEALISEGLEIETLYVERIEGR